MSRHLILATAGHVDHGKTALIKALTGVDTDRLPEEKARGITIDLGFAHLALPGFSIGIIDVPGHEDFIRNMIAGIGSIDLALLVVAADDGWMPQTEEHLQILDYLGVRHGMVAITKCDLGEGERVAKEVRAQLEGTSLGDAPVALVSAGNFASVELLTETIAQQCARIPEPRDIGKPRLFVDRAFTLRGSGTIATGTLSGGQLQRGQTISLQPQNLHARVRSLQSHNKPIEGALPSMRVALNLPELTLEQVPRGTVVTAENGGQLSQAIDVALEGSARQPPRARALKSGSSVHVHYGSARHVARVTLLDGGEMLPGERAIARLKFETPLFVFVGDRFIIRDSSAQRTIAGGLVLDADADHSEIRSSAQREFLASRAAAPNDLPTLLRSELRREKFVRREVLLPKSNFGWEEIQAAVEELARGGAMFRRDDIVADICWWQALCDRARKTIEAAHSAHPDHLGIELSQLRAVLGMNDATLFELLIDHLVMKEHRAAAPAFERIGSAVRRTGYRPSLPPQLQDAGEEIRRALAARPFDPPSRKELVSDARAQDALRFLRQSGEVVVLNEDLILLAEVCAKMKMRVLDSLRARGAATTSQLRQTLGTTRRVLVPLLEHCDREGLTMRRGDQRVLR